MRQLLRAPAGLLGAFCSQQPSSHVKTFSVNSAQKPRSQDGFLSNYEQPLHNLVREGLPTNHPENLRIPRGTVAGLGYNT